MTMKMFFLNLIAWATLVAGMGLAPHGVEAAKPKQKPAAEAENKDIIGHIHTAGNPGRKELDDTQEINYPPIMRKLLDIGYKGHVGQEFIPTGDPMKGLIEAVELCDV